MILKVDVTEEQGMKYGRREAKILNISHESFKRAWKRNKEKGLEKKNKLR